MTKYLLTVARAVVAVLALAAMFGKAEAQTVVAQPNFAAPRTVVDLGNGPTEILPVNGNGAVFTSFGTGVGSTSGSSTTLTLTASAAANPPCVGCVISGTGITSGTTVAAFNGTTTITLSAAMTVAASTALGWGMACPVSTQAAPVQPSVGMALIQPGVAPGGIPMYTQGRVCAYGGVGPGLSFINFPIGAH